MSRVKYCKGIIHQRGLISNEKCIFIFFGSFYPKADCDGYQRRFKISNNGVIRYISSLNEQRSGTCKYNLLHNISISLFGGHVGVAINLTKEFQLASFLCDFVIIQRGRHGKHFCFVIIFVAFLVQCTYVIFLKLINNSRRKFKRN